MSKEKIPTQEIGELLDMVTQKLPGLIREIVATFYTEEAAANLGKAVGTFYRQLIDAGFPEEHAMGLTMEYINILMSLLREFKVDKK